ncbi:MAG TPA: LuxR C-terminal-related transcriptional regulator [Asanoa sp.]
MSGPTTRLSHRSRPATRLRRVSRLNTARLAVPQPPVPLIVRARLLARLDVATRGPVTLVSAPAGSGKTTLANSWATARPDRHIAWLTLDDADNDPAHLWRYLIAALTSAANRPAAFPVDRVAVPDEAHALAERMPPTVLVLDDAQRLRAGPATAALAALVRRPSPVRLLLCARGAPPLPLARMALAGELVTVGADDLAFTVDEARELARAHGAAVTEMELRASVDHSEGWAVGLRFALTGEGPYGLADYFAQEILTEQPAEVRDFLLRTSMLDHLSPDAADAVTESDTGARLLDLIVHGDLFARQRPDGETVRLHPMFRAFLRREAGVRLAAEMPSLHLRAARWYAGNRQAVTGARHALAAGESTMAAELLAGPAAPQIFGPQRDVVRRLLERIPPAAADGGPYVPAALALAAMCRRDPAAVARHAASARDLLPSVPSEERAATRAVLSMVDVTSARWRGDLSVRAEPDGPGVSDVPGLRAVALVHRGLTQLWEGSVDDAEETLAAAVEATRARRLDLSLVDALGQASLVAASRGRLREAAAHGREAAQLAGRRGWTHAMQATSAFLGLAVVHCQRADLDGAEMHLAVARAGCRRDPERTTAVVVDLVDARIRLARQDVTGAAAAVAATRDAVRGWLPPPLLRDWITLVGGDVDVAAGRAEAAVERLGPLSGAGPASALAAPASVAAARAQLALGRPEAARDLLARVVTRKRKADVAARVEAWLVDALAAARLGHDGAVAIGISEALSLAAPEGLLRPFLLTGADLGHVLTRHHDLLTGAFGERVDALLDAHAPAAKVLDPVTDREAVVARYLPTLLTTTDIAKELYVSANTVKSHLRSLYRKLGVGNRRDAVHAARRLGLL